MTNAKTVRVAGLILLAACAAADVTLLGPLQASLQRSVALLALNTASIGAIFLAARTPARAFAAAGLVAGGVAVAWLVVLEMSCDPAFLGFGAIILAAFVGPIIAVMLAWFPVAGLAGVAVVALAYAIDRFPGIRPRVWIATFVLVPAALTWTIERFVWHAQNVHGNCVI